MSSDREEIDVQAGAGQFAVIAGRKIEYLWFRPARDTASDTESNTASGPVIVMLHEGLGSASMWKDFPQQLAEVTGAVVLAYSRFGYGCSDPPTQAYAALRMHEHEALEILPLLLNSLGIERPVLFGHSDGASIALIYAGAVPDAVSGVIVLAPHVFVEPMCIRRIEEAQQSFVRTDMRDKLARYHRNPERAFRLWSHVWLDPAFMSWNIEHYLHRIRCPVLAIQGYDDEYGTMEQLARIDRHVPGATFLKLAQCGHSPHRDQSTSVLEASSRFLDVR